MSCSLDRMRRYWPEKEKVTAEGCWSAYADPFNPLIVALAARFAGVEIGRPDLSVTASSAGGKFLQIAQLVRSPLGQY